VGACLERRVTIYPQGFMPPAQAVPMGRQDGLLAGLVPFALGADMVMPFTYELMKIIPGFFEAFAEARRLLPDLHSHRPYAYATVICPQQSEIYGHYDRDWGCQDLRLMAEMVFLTGLPWRWLWDQRLEDPAGVPAAPVICPEVHCLMAGQIERIRAAGGALWIGNMPRGPWAGSGPCPLPAAVERGVFRLKVESDHPLVAGLEDPIVLSSRVDWSGPEGEVLATLAGRPALVLGEGGQTWIAGPPAVQYFGEIPGAWSVVPTSNVELMRRLIIRAGGERPLMRLDPFPPIDDYRTLRPGDRRAVPTIEMLPMVRRDDAGAVRSLLAIVFPYTPVGCESAIEVALPPGAAVRRVEELWSGGDWADRMLQTDAGTVRIPFRIPGDLDLLALKLTF
jgi:hypothetical protein